ncbi:hypothetical protein FSS13T_12390 [Flavobacterium saliperosum S13]|nr:hypothetical protein [Flavobacterium saliperosum]ESU26088.1 hypothetical protein FSS13T_12390 [Flavobacterium saliperosum S13]
MQTIDLQIFQNAYTYSANDGFGSEDLGIIVVWTSKEIDFTQ